MGHNNSKEWLNNLTTQQKKFLLKKHGKWSQFSVNNFDNNTRDRLMKQYQGDLEFLNLGSQITSSSLKDWTQITKDDF